RADPVAGAGVPCRAAREHGRASAVGQAEPALVHGGVELDVAHTARERERSRDRRRPVYGDVGGVGHATIEVQAEPGLRRWVRHAQPADRRLGAERRNPAAVERSERGVAETTDVVYIL